MAVPDSPAQPAPRSASTPVLSVSFTRDALIIQGEQFAPGERVRVYLAAMPSAGFEQFTLLGETTADARGALILTAGLPMRHIPEGGAEMAHVIAQGSVTRFTAFAGVAVPAAVADVIRIAGGGEPATPAPTETPLPPSPTSTPEPTGEWFAEYYTNRDLGGPPVLTRMEEARCDARHQWLCLNWGRASAGDGMPANQWSAIFTRTITLDTLDNYIFELWVDDGARVYVDGQLIINEWRQGRWRAAYGFTVRSPGEHTLRVEYFDASGAARIRLSWWAGYTAWEARYYNSPYLDGPVILKRDDHDINFTDKPGEGPLWPAGIGPDNFSVDWVRVVHFPCSCEYEFSVAADDDVRVFIDGQAKPLIDLFGKGPGSDSAIRFMRAGRHLIQVQYVERGQDAYVRFYWRPLCPFPPPTVIPPDP